MDRIILMSLASMAAIAIAAPAGSAPQKDTTVIYAPSARADTRIETDSQIVQTRHVVYRMSDLRTQAGVAAFRGRIRVAVGQVCAYNKHPDWSSKPERDCRSRTNWSIRPKMKAILAMAESGSNVAMTAPLVVAAAN